MRRKLCLVALAALTGAACGGFATTPPVSRDLGSAPETTTSSTQPPSTTTSSSVFLSLPPSSTPLASDALVTPSGVIVAILEQTNSGFSVRTPCGDEATVPWGTPIGPVDVVIDPGHGGEADPGAQGSNGLTESEVNLAVSRLVVEHLGKRGVSAILTRTRDYASTLGMRALLADQVGASLMVSIHHNAPAPGPSAIPGTEVFVQSDSADSRRLGGLLYQQAIEALSTFDVAWTSAPDAGVLEVLNTRGTDAYGMLRTPETVTALIELGYIANPVEAELFATQEYVEVAATAVVEAVVAYLDTDEPGTGFIAEARVFNPQPGISGDVCQDPELY
ncbi:MAG: N-acetylmuramoyl-L-alanine amidase [Actinobacteria bacterium]|nr:MAG: N-acetylmuramoyl-L-alanine amidase [Actinomycetota bacterium]